MSDNRYDILCSFIHKISTEASDEFLREAVSELEDKLWGYTDEKTVLLVKDIKNLEGRLAFNKNEIFNSNNFNCQEQSEYLEAIRIIDNNLFDYHFQPMVSVKDGSIYSFEALMRPMSDICRKPKDILKYAECADRLDDIEKTTFVNILERVEKYKNKLNGRKVFINSIPKTSLSDEDLEYIDELLKRNSDIVVVEMTEQSELSEEEFEITKKRYNRLNVKIAVDDYGTGYANVKNLLQYMPSYVKIDRTLLHNLQSDRKKLHFVREIIDFCHDNKILALAEGVETSDELRTVIRLGVDLVQGFYTACPASEPVEKIPYIIRQEILLYRQEYESGRDMHIYFAEDNERVSLDRLVKDNYSRVVIGQKGNGDVTLVGTPGVEQPIYIDIKEKYNGKITIENIDIISDKDNPCITLGEGSDVKLAFSGQNHLRKSGIKVPETAKLTCCGDGNLYIYVDGLSFFGIGNDENSRHGELIFEKGVSVDNNSASGVCIGSGLGGKKIRINNGKFVLKMTGNYGIGIGSFKTDMDIDIKGCDMEIDMSVQTAVGIGSFEGQCFARVKNSYIDITTMGVLVVGIGTVNGELCGLVVRESKTIVKTVGDNCTAIGAVSGATNFKLERAGVNISSEGEKALAIGGFNKDTKINLIYADTSIRLASDKVDYKDYYEAERVVIDGGRTRFVFNEQSVIDR